jgi:hypothetical protein
MPGTLFMRRFEMSEIHVGDCVMVTPTSGHTSALFGQVAEIERNTDNRPMRYLVQWLRTDPTKASGSTWIGRHRVTSYAALKAWDGPVAAVEEALAELRKQVQE